MSMGGSSVFALPGSEVSSDAGGESDASTCDDVPNSNRMTNMARLRSLQQENNVLKLEVDTLKLKNKNLKEENEELKRARVNLQARAEQEEEYISNTLLRKIHTLKKEKEVLATTYEQEEEYLTNDLSRKLAKLRQEKLQLETTLEQEQQNQISKLMKKIEKLEQETSKKQAALEELRRDKVNLENLLEQEQEQLVNKLWKQMDSLEQQKLELMRRLDNQEHTLGAMNPASPDNQSDTTGVNGASTATNGVSSPNSTNSTIVPAPAPSVSPLGAQQQTRHHSGLGTGSGRAGLGSQNSTVTSLALKIDELRMEVARLRKQLKQCQIEHAKKLEEVGKEEIALRTEKLLLERKLAREKERSDALNRQLSESESSLEIDDERQFNEIRKNVSSPIPVNSPIHHRSISGGLNVQVGSSPSVAKCPYCLQVLPPGSRDPALGASVGPHSGSSVFFPGASTQPSQPGPGGAGPGVPTTPLGGVSPVAMPYSSSPPAGTVHPPPSTSQRTRLFSGSSSSKSPLSNLANDSTG